MSHSGKLRNMASVYFTRNDEILLLHRQGSSIVSNLWIGSAGGHFESNELNDAKSCVLRELSEELSLAQSQIQNLQLRYITIRNFNDEIRQNYYFFAELGPNTPETLISTEGTLKWVSLQRAFQYPMPFTAKYVVDHYLKIGQYNNFLYGGVGNDDGVIFTKL